MADHIYTLQVYIENTQTGIKAVGKMKYLTRQNKLLKKRSALKTLGSALKTLGLLSLSPALAGLGISSMKDVKEIYDNIPVKNNEDTKEINYTYSSKIELSPVLLAQIEEYLEECKKI